MAAQESDLNDFLKTAEFDKDGVLMKLSSKNVWQKRYYQLRGPYLMYWASASGTKKGIVKGNVIGTPNVSIDLRLIRSADVLKGNVLILTSKSGQLFSLKSSSKNENDISEWVNVINIQISEEKEKRLSESSEVTKRKDSRPTVLISHESSAYDNETGNNDHPNQDKIELNIVNEDEENENNFVHNNDEKGDIEMKNKNSNPIEKEEEFAAAAKVQAITRQKLSKKRVENIREDKVKHEKATLKIQNLSRQKTAMKKVEAIRVEKKQDEEKIVKIQGIMRQKCAQKKVNRIREPGGKEQTNNDKIVSEGKEQAKETVTENNSSSSNTTTAPPATTTAPAAALTAPAVGVKPGKEEDKFASNYRGLLEKAGHFVNTGYKTRMFVLTRDPNNFNYWTLNYYVDEGQGRLGEKKGDIILKEALIETSTASADGSGLELNEFTIVCTDKTFPLRAPNAEIAKEWQKRLRCAIKENDANNLAVTNNLNSSAIDRASNGEAFAKVIGDGNTGGPSFRGVLEKAGHFLNTGYKSRLFVLAATPPANDWVLFYYLDEGQGRLGELKGEIILKNATLEQGKGVEFAVITKDKSFPLRAADIDTCETWKEKIQQAIELSTKAKSPSKSK